MDKLLGILGEGPADWEGALAFVTETMQEMSRQPGPAEMVRAYGKRMQAIFPADRFIAISRRGLDEGRFRVTRDSTRSEEIDPWKQKEKLPLLQGGLLAELLYGNRAVVMNDLKMDTDDPGCAILCPARSLMTLPVFDHGEAINMTILLHKDPDAFRQELLPIQVWTANLFGRATQNRVLADQLKQANDIIDREMRTIGEIQRSLLPGELPQIDTLDIAAHYKTATQAGGDYYDFFPLEKNKLGIIVADVSGHGSPAAVLMAITHVLAHTRPAGHIDAGQILAYVNHHLANRYNPANQAFVTAFFGVYDSANRTMRYASAGHPPPRVKRCSDGSVFNLDGVGDLPLGVMPDTAYDETSVQFVPGDQMILYTDGITETFNPAGEMFGNDRLDTALANCHLDAAGLIESVMSQVNQFAASRPAEDDRTLIVGKVR
jgi:sigma-B regulation protein RsbU (phosphoserine phosphatase)